MGEAHLVAEPRAHRLAHCVEPLGRKRLRPPAALTEQVLPLAVADKHVQARTMTEMHVAHDPHALEGLEVAVHLGHVELGSLGPLQAPGEPLGRHWLAGREQRL